MTTDEPRGKQKRTPPGELRDFYPVTCPKETCVTSFEVAPCIGMSMGANSGHASCPGCNLFLHLEIAPDHSAMIAMDHGEWLEQFARLADDSEPT